MAKPGPSGDFLQRNRTSLTRLCASSRLRRLSIERKDKIEKMLIVPIVISYPFQDDNIWNFALGLFLVEITPQSLTFTATYGLAAGCAVLLFGTVVGDWVDITPRLTG